MANRRIAGELSLDDKRRAAEFAALAERLAILDHLWTSYLSEKQALLRGDREVLLEMISEMVFLFERMREAARWLSSLLDRRVDAIPVRDSLNSWVLTEASDIPGMDRLSDIIQNEGGTIPFLKGRLRKASVAFDENIEILSSKASRLRQGEFVPGDWVVIACCAVGAIGIVAGAATGNRHVAKAGWVLAVICCE